jgi:glutamyl-tRNA synthetase
LRGRFAPSPTGELHLGNVRTALLAWLQVRSRGGRFVLRVEDLDRGRVRPEYLQGQLHDLRWLGLDWDEGPGVGGDHSPYLQSLRQERYGAALQTLEEKGLLFPCFCSRREIAAAASAPHEDEEGPAYSGFCRKGDAGRRSGTHALRFRVPEEPVTFQDELQGARSYLPSVDSGDFVVRRKDGVAAYQLAVVVDDAAMRISDVLRGADLLSSTARQILLYRALELDPPNWSHVPLLLGPDGERFSKRHGALPLRELRQKGIEPQRIVGWLASTCNLAAENETIDPRGLVQRWEIARLPTENTICTLPDWITGATP